MKVISFKSTVRIPNEAKIFHLPTSNDAKMWTFLQNIRTIKTGQKWQNEILRPQCIKLTNVITNYVINKNSQSLKEIHRLFQWLE